MMNKRKEMVKTVAGARRMGALILATLLLLGACPSQALAQEDGSTGQAWEPVIVGAEEIMISSNANLADLRFKYENANSPVPGFSSSTYEYTVKLPYNVSPTATVTLIGDPSSSMGKTSGGTVTLSNGRGTAVLTVTAASGKTKTYTVNFYRALSDDAYLSGMSYSINGHKPKSVPGFDADVYTYEVVLPYTTAKNAVITMSPSLRDNMADVKRNAGVTLVDGKGTASVTIESFAGNVRKTYMVKFKVLELSDYWDDIAENFEPLFNGTQEVDMTSIPILRFDEIEGVFKGSKRILRLNFSDRLYWTIRAKDYVAPTAEGTEYDMTIQEGSPSKAMYSQTGNAAYLFIRMNYTGEYPFPFTLNLKLMERYGRTIYAYDYDGSKYRPIGSSFIPYATGVATFELTRGYSTIVFTTKPLTNASLNKEQQLETAKTHMEAVEILLTKYIKARK